MYNLFLEGNIKALTYNINATGHYLVLPGIHLQLLLKVNAVRHTLTTATDVNRTIYTSCIEQFWVAATAKNINGEARIHAKVDGKKVIIFEATIRRDLRFEDEGGVDCLLNEVIFEQLPLMGMVKHLDIGTKFLMYPRFMQVFLDKQVDEMSRHNAIYVIPSHTKKVFSNMNRVGEDFSGRDTPLFPTMIVQAQEELGKDTKIPTDTQHTSTIIQPTTSQPQRKQKLRKRSRKDSELPQNSVPTKVVADEAVYEEMYDSVERAATTATGLDTEQDRGIISKTQFTATLNEPSSIRTSSDSGPKRQETMRDAAAQTRSERVSKFSNNPPLSRVNTLGSGEDRLQLKQLMELCIILSDGVLDLEKTKTVQAREIANLKKRVKRLERKKKSRSYGLKRLYKVRLSARVESSAEEESLDITTANIEETVSTAAPITTAVTDDELTMAQALMEIKKSKPKGATTTTTVTIPTPDSTRPKLIEDENLAWDNVQAMMDADYELAARLQEEEQGELTIEEKSRLFVELMDKRNKHFAKLKAEEKRRKPPTKAQKRNQMCVY
nr:hypothetical protein [Tanacetum cinerariifolium]